MAAERTPYAYQTKAAAEMVAIVGASTTEKCSGILEAPFGSGKTLAILLYLSTRRAVVPYPVQFYESSCGRRLVRESLNYETLYTIKKRNEEVVRYDFQKIISCAIVVVAGSVFFQWVNEIKATKLRVFLVLNGVDVTKLFALVANRTINAYDIVLVKNGTTNVCPAALRSRMAARKS